MHISAYYIFYQKLLPHQNSMTNKIYSRPYHLGSSDLQSGIKKFFIFPNHIAYKKVSLMNSNGVESRVTHFHSFPKLSQTFCFILSLEALETKD